MAVLLGGHYLFPVQVCCVVSRILLLFPFVILDTKGRAELQPWTGIMSKLKSFLGLTARFQFCPLLVNHAWDKLACSSTEQDDLVLSETHICLFLYNIECVLLFSPKCSFWMDTVQGEALGCEAWCSLANSPYCGVQSCPPPAAPCVIPLALVLDPAPAES